MKVKEESEKVDLKLSIQETKIMASGPIASWQIYGEAIEILADFIFLDSQITADGDCSHEIKRHLLLGRKAMTNLDSILKSKDITLLTKAYLVKAKVLPSSHIWMWELDYKESWALKSWCFWTVKRSNQSILKEISPEYLWEGLMLELKPIFWPPDATNWLTWKDPDTEKNWRQEEKGTMENETVGWHHQLDGHEFEQVLGVSDGPGSLACCNPWGHKESNITGWLH